MVLKHLYLAITSTLAPGELNFRFSAQLVSSSTLQTERDLVLRISVCRVNLERILQFRQTFASPADQDLFVTKRLTQRLLLFMTHIMERFVLKATTALRDLLKVYPVLEVLTVSKRDLRRLKNAVSALLILITTNRDLKDANLAVSSLSPKRAHLIVLAEVHSVLTRAKTLLAVAVVDTSSRMNKVKS